MTYTPSVPVESRTHRHYAISTFGYDAATEYIATTVVSSQAWPLANLALYVPFQINETLTVYEARLGTGATARGHYDIGIYDLAGTRLVSSGTQGRTASTWEVAPLTDTELTPGWYYAAMSADSTNNYSGTSSYGAGFLEALGVCEQTSAFTLPSTAT